MEVLDNLGVGDVVHCKGLNIEVAYITSNDGYAVEFYDSRGEYRNWKPEIDGGRVSLVGKEKANKAKYSMICKNGLREYHDPYTNRFIIPFEDVDYNASKAIIELISNGWALSAYYDGDEKFYTVFNIREDSNGWYPIGVRDSKCLLEEILKPKGYVYAPGTSIKAYMESEGIQKVVDLVLLEGCRSDGRTVCVRCDGKNLDFIVVHNAFE